MIMKHVTVKENADVFSRVKLQMFANKDRHFRWNITFCPLHPLPSAKARFSRLQNPLLPTPASDI